MPEPDRTSPPLRRKAWSAGPVPKSETLEPRASRAGLVPGGHTREQVALTAPGRLSPARPHSFSGGVHAPAESPVPPDLNRARTESRSDQVGACILIVLAVLTVTTELPLLWLARLAEALR